MRRADPPPPTKPSDCAIAVGLPLERCDFEASLEGTVDYDFARSVIRQFPRQTPEAVWNTFVAPRVTLLENLLDEAAALGVGTVTGVTLEDLRFLFARHRVVTVVAHWRAGTIWPEQVADLDAVVAAVASANEGPLARVRQAIWGKNGEPNAPKAEPSVLMDAFCKAANRVMKEEDLGPSECPDGWHRSVNPHYRLYANRTSLDEVLGASVFQGNRLELADGMHSAKEVLRAIPGRFSGLIDLTVCNSAMLGERLKAERRLSCIVSEEEVGLSFRVQAYRATLRLIASTPCEYSEAAVEVRMALLEEARLRRDFRTKSVLSWRPWE